MQPSGVFGGPAAQSLLGNKANMFNTQGSSSLGLTGLLGSNTQNNYGSNLLGNNGIFPQSSATGTATGVNIFGGANTSSNIFGAGTSGGGMSTNIFGQANNPIQPSSFGISNQNQNIFSQQPQVNAFGNVTGQQQTFGGQNTGMNGFGTPSANFSMTGGQMNSQNIFGGQNMGGMNTQQQGQGQLQGTVDFV